MRNKPHGSANKRLGDRVELRFMEKALAHGFDLLRPWGDNSAYDIAVLVPTGVRRVQVRATATLAFGRYRVQAVFGARKRAYTRGLIDFLAAYVFPCDVWYIVPASFLRNRNNIYMRPHVTCGSSPGERFREAWHLLE